MRIAILLVLGGAALVSASALAEPADTLPTPPVEPGLPRPPIEQVPSDDVEARAQALLDEARVCTTDNGCELHSFERLLGPDSCIGAFQCTGALSADADLDVFVQRALPLIAEQRASGACAMASCAPPSELRAVCVAQRCELVPAQPSDGPENVPPEPLPQERPL